MHVDVCIPTLPPRPEPLPVETSHPGLCLPSLGIQRSMSFPAQSLLFLTGVRLVRSWKRVSPCHGMGREVGFDWPPSMYVRSKLSMSCNAQDPSSPLCPGQTQFIHSSFYSFIQSTK